MLRVDIRDLQRGSARTKGQLDAGDPVFEGLDLDVVGRCLVDGQLQATSEGEYLWRGSIHAVVRGECRRCLAEVLEEVDLDVNAAVFSSDPEAADDPGLLSFATEAHERRCGPPSFGKNSRSRSPSHLLLCRDDCAGLCPRCGADLNAGPCACRTSAEPV